MLKSLEKYFPVFVLPTLTAFVLAFVIPFFMGIYLSFTEFTAVTNAKWVGLANYVKAFTANREFINAGWFTIRFAVVSIISINILAFALALLLTRGLKGTNLFRTVFFMPNLIGGIVLGYVWLLIIDGILQHFGTALNLYAKYGFWGLIIVVCWQQIGYMMIIYIAGLQAIPEDLNEAAGIDGATGRQKLFRITIPMMMPSITICTFLSVTNGFKLFDQNLALTNGAPGKETEMLAMNIFTTFYNRVGFEGVGQAKAVLFFILVVTLGLLQLRLTRSKEVQH